VHDFTLTLALSLREKGKGGTVHDFTLTLTLSLRGREKGGTVHPE